MKRHIYKSLIVAALTAATVGVTFVITERAILAQTAVAFTATRRDVAYDQSGAQKLDQTIILAVRGDGSTVRSVTVMKPGGRGLAEQRTVTDLHRGAEISVSGVTESLTTFPLSPKVVLRLKARAVNGCQNVDRSDKSTILGYNVFRFTYNSKLFDNSIMKTEEWVAPDLNCMPLKAVVRVGKSEAEMRLSNVEEVTEIKMGEPDASLFAIPPSYTELTPSQVTEEFNRRYPELAQSCPNCTKKGDEVGDRKYFKSRGDR